MRDFLPAVLDFLTSPAVLIAYYPTLGAIAALIAGIELLLAWTGHKTAFLAGIAAAAVLVAIWWFTPIRADAMGAIAAPLAKKGALVTLSVTALAGLLLLQKHARKTEVSREPI